MTEGSDAESKDPEDLSRDHLCSTRFADNTTKYGIFGERHSKMCNTELYEAQL
jgi:hypothetical protein